MRWISSVLKPSAMGRTTPGSTATSYNSLTIPSRRTQWTTSLLQQVDHLGRPQRASGAAPLQFFVQAASPPNVLSWRGWDSPTTA